MTCPARGLGGQRVTEEHDAVDVAVGHLGGTLDVAAVRPGGRPLDCQPRRLADAFAGRAGPEQVEVRDVTVSATATAESVRRTLAESDGTGRPTVEDTLAGDATSGPATSDGGAGDEVAIDSMTGGGDTVRRRWWQDRPGDTPGHLSPRPARGRCGRRGRARGGSGTD